LESKVRKNRFLRFVLKLVAIFIGVYAFLLLFVPLLGFGWHLLHGNYISHNGWRIPIPEGYYVTNEPHGPAIWKLTLGAPRFEVPFAHVSFYTRQTHPFKASVDYAPFEESMTRNAADSGHHFKERRVIPVGNGSAYCVEFSREKKQPRSLVRCAVEDSNMYIFFEGDSRYLPDLTNTLREMSLEAPYRQSKSGTS
jgi:hypothetical protein